MPPAQVKINAESVIRRCFSELRLTAGKTKFVRSVAQRLVLERRKRERIGTANVMELLLEEVERCLALEDIHGETLDNARHDMYGYFASVEPFFDGFHVNDLSSLAGAYATAEFVTLPTSVSLWTVIAESRDWVQTSKRLPAETESEYANAFVARFAGKLVSVATISAFVDYLTEDSREQRKYALWLAAVFERLVGMGKVPAPFLKRLKQRLLLPV